MQKWILKAFVQKTISILPYSQKVNFIFQKYITRGVTLSDTYFNDRLFHALKHYSVYVDTFGKAPLQVLELGTGWYPFVPLFFYLNGADEIWSIDISKLTNRERLLAAIQRIIDYIDSYKNEQVFQSKNFIPARIEVLRNIVSNEHISKNQILEKLNLHLIQTDARKTSFTNGYFDLVVSNNTFEHIYPGILSEILIELFRIVKKPGLMSHSIDMSDHFAHLDKTITIYNFLKFSDSAWKFIDNSVQPQNRMRLKDYEELLTKVNIPFVVESTFKGDPNGLNSLKLNKKFQNYSPSDLAISQCHFLCIKN